MLEVSSAPLNIDSENWTHVRRMLFDFKARYIKLVLEQLRSAHSRVLCHLIYIQRGER